jgi:hypothetical protein
MFSDQNFVFVLIVNLFLQHPVRDENVLFLKIYWSHEDELNPSWHKLPQGEVNKHKKKLIHE